MNAHPGKLLPGLQTKLWQLKLEHLDIIALPIRMELGLRHLHASSAAAMHTYVCRNIYKI